MTFYLPTWKNNAAFEHGRVTINRFSEIQASIRMHSVHYKFISFFNKLHFIINCLIDIFLVKIGFKKEGGIASLASCTCVATHFEKMKHFEKKIQTALNFYQVK